MLQLKKIFRKKPILSYYLEVYSNKWNLFPYSTPIVRYASNSSLSSNDPDKEKFDYEKFRVKYGSNPTFSGAFTFLRGEFAKFCEEFKEGVPFNAKEFQDRDPNQIDMLYSFNKENSLDDFVVTTDSAHDEGYTSASLKITQHKTALFSGHIDTTVPKTGNVHYAGYANMMSRAKVLSFGRIGRHDWTYYTHLVFKIRGDGRTYLIILPTPGNLNVSEHLKFCYPLYTRGGPYWQLTKIPFNQFFLTMKTRTSDHQINTVPLDKVTKLGITLSDGIDGPFKLEIDYIGLEKVEYYRNICPYEQYHVQKALAT